MTSSIKRSFERNVRGFLGSAWLRRTTTAKQLSRITKSSLADPIEPVDTIFTTVSDGDQSSNSFVGFKSITRQLLANHVLESLIEAQSDMTQLDEVPYQPDNLSAHVTHVYRHVQEIFPKENTGPHSIAS